MSMPFYRELITRKEQEENDEDRRPNGKPSLGQMAGFRKIQVASQDSANMS